MKRFHVHIAVDDIAANVRFYSTVFGQSPSVVKDDYAKWMIEDPRINFAISRRGHRTGVSHLGIELDSDEELGGLRSRMADADVALLDQANASCCYARSNKYWIADPQGIAWETYHTLDSIPAFGEDSVTSAAADVREDVACCVPSRKKIQKAAAKPQSSGCCN